MIVTGDFTPRFGFLRAKKERYSHQEAMVSDRLKREWPFDKNHTFFGRNCSEKHNTLALHAQEFFRNWRIWRKVFAFLRKRWFWGIRSSMYMLKASNSLQSIKMSLFRPILTLAKPLIFKNHQSTNHTIPCHPLLYYISDSCAFIIVASRHEGDV